MKLGTLILSTLLISSLILAGCSGENTDDTLTKKVVVRKPIIDPPEEKDIAQVQDVEKPAPVAEEENIDETEEAAAEEFYITGGDESLSMIAARDDVYGDPLKWIILYRLNLDAFKENKKDESFPDQIVPAETRLKIAAPAVAEKTLINGDEDRYVVNVLSSSEGEKIAPKAIKLVDSGYNAYITVANVNGHDFHRLRVGFYDKRAMAEEAGQKIAGLLNVSDVWTAMADELELNDYGGYE